MGKVKWASVADAYRSWICRKEGHYMRAAYRGSSCAGWHRGQAGKVWGPCVKTDPRSQAKEQTASKMLPLAEDESELEGHEESGSLCTI